jgi:hypothetical protein
MDRNEQENKLPSQLNDLLAAESIDEENLSAPTSESPTLSDFSSGSSSESDDTGNETAHSLQQYCSLTIDDTDTKNILNVDADTVTEFWSFKTANESAVAEIYSTLLKDVSQQTRYKIWGYI